MEPAQADAEGGALYKVLANPQLLNPYVYCLNNPTKNVDPNGLDVIVSKEMKGYVNDAYNKSATFRAKYDNLRMNKDVLVRISGGLGVLDNNKRGVTVLPKNIPNSDSYKLDIPIIIDIKNSDKAGTIGHELQHANEIAGLKNNEELNQYKEKLKANNNCTPEAQEVNEIVTKEMLDDKDDLKTKEDVTKVYRLDKEEAK